MTEPASLDVDILSGIESFVRDRCNVESSVVVDSCIDDLLAASSLEAMYAVPIQHRMFTLLDAIAWAFFCNTLQKSGKLGDFATSFDAGKAMHLAESVYDLGTQELVWSAFGDDETETDSGSETDEEVD